MIKIEIDLILSEFQITFASLLASSSEHEEAHLEITAERSTAETKASAYSLPMTPMVQKKEKSKSMKKVMMAMDHLLWPVKMAICQLSTGCWN